MYHNDSTVLILLYRIPMILCVVEISSSHVVLFGLLSYLFKLSLLLETPGVAVFRWTDLHYVQ